VYIFRKKLKCCIHPHHQIHPLMLAFYFWQILIFLNTVKLSRTTELDLELRLGLSRNNEREDTNKEPNPISEKQNERKRKRKTHRNPTPLLQAGKQIEKDKPLPSAQQLKEDEEKAENLLARRLKRQHDKIMVSFRVLRITFVFISLLTLPFSQGKQLTESQKASHRESMKRYRTKVRANPELYAEMKKRVKENKNERLQFAKQDPTEIAWLKEVKKGYNRKHREKLRQVKLKSKNGKQI